MYVIIKVKDTENIIGLKEDIAARLEDVADIKGVVILDDKEIKDINTYGNRSGRERIKNG